MNKNNSITLKGHLGRDSEVRELQNSRHVTSFSVACTESYKDKQGQWQKNTEWVPVTAWDNLVLAKGQFVLVEGKFTTRSWEKDGVKHYRSEVTAESVYKLEYAKPREQADGSGAYPAEAKSNLPAGGTPTPESEVDDLPF